MFFAAAWVAVAWAFHLERYAGIHWLAPWFAAAFVLLHSSGRVTFIFFLFVAALAGATLFLLNFGWVLQPAVAVAAGRACCRRCCGCR